MAYELQRLAASGETAYISKHNANYSTIEAALNAIAGVVSSAAGGGAPATLPVALKALFGATPAVIGAGSYRPTIAGLTLEVAPGFAWLAGAGVVVGSGSPVVLDLAALADGTHYLTADGAGAPKLADSAEDALWSVVKGGGALSTLTRLAVIAWGQSDWAGAQDSAANGSFEKLDDRLEAIESSIGAVDLSGYETSAHAAATYLLAAKRGLADGVASLGSDGKLPLAQAAFSDFQFPFFFSGKPGNAALMWKVKAAIAFTLPQNLAGSNGNVGTNPTATTTLDIQVNGVSKGSVSIATSGAVTFTFATAVSVAVGDVLKMVAQATADATCADISITLYGTR